MNNSWIEQFNKVDADGIDFVSFGFNPSCFNQFNKIYCSYTKEEFLEQDSYPRTPYLFWKIKDGIKVYLKNN